MVNISLFFYVVDQALNVDFFCNLFDMGYSILLRDFFCEFNVYLNISDVVDSAGKHTFSSLQIEALFQHTLTKNVSLQQLKQLS